MLLFAIKAYNDFTKKGVLRMPQEFEVDGKKQVFYTAEELAANALEEKTKREQAERERDELLSKDAEKQALIKQAEIDKAKADNDVATMARLMEEQKAESLALIEKRDNAIKSEKVNVFLSADVNKFGAGGNLNNDLETLIKARFDIDYNIDDKVIVVRDKQSGQLVPNLKKHIVESGNYDQYLSGGSASGAGAKGGEFAQLNDKNPFKKGEHFNLTKQAEIVRSNPSLAAKLKSQI